jgi:hypothetical protein
VRRPIRSCAARRRRARRGSRSGSPSARRHDRQRRLAQLYRGFDVGTAKPTRGARARPHVGIDVLEPTQRASAAWWADSADAWIRERVRRARARRRRRDRSLSARAVRRAVRGAAARRGRVARAPARAGVVDTETLRRWVRELDPARATLGARSCCARRDRAPHRPARERSPPRAERARAMVARAISSSIRDRARDADRGARPTPCCGRLAGRGARADAQTSRQTPGVERHGLRAIRRSRAASSPSGRGAARHRGHATVRQTAAHLVPAPARRRRRDTPRSARPRVGARALSWWQTWHA